MKRVLFVLMLLLAGCAKQECSSYAADQCPTSCVVCPPCAECSSLTCQTETFCKDIGFDREWGEEIKVRLEN